MLIQYGANNFEGTELIGFLLATMECQNSCVFCGAERLNSGKHIPFRTATRQLEDWYSYGARQLIISGGEPLHNPDLQSIIKAGHEIGYSKVVLYSTAAFEEVSITPNDLKYVDVMMVSIFGKNAKKHDAVARNKGAFDKTINGIKEACKSDIKISINTPVTRSNVNDLHEIMDLLELFPSQVFGWQLGDIHPTFEAKKRNNLHVSYASVGEEVKSILSRARRSSLVVLTQEFPLCVTNPWLLEAQELIKASNETFISGKTYNSHDYVFVKPLTSNSKSYALCCEECSLKGVCKGVSSAYLESTDIASELIPIPELSVEALQRSASSRWSKTKAELGLEF